MPRTSSWRLCRLAFRSGRSKDLEIIRQRGGLTAGDPYDELACVWAGQELLRDVLAADTARSARRRLDSFYDWCDTHGDIPELVSLAGSIRTWQAPLR